MSVYTVEEEIEMLRDDNKQTVEEERGGRGTDLSFDGPNERGLTCARSIVSFRSKFDMSVRILDSTRPCLLIRDGYR